MRVTMLNIMLLSLCVMGLGPLRVATTTEVEPKATPPKRSGGIVNLVGFTTMPKVKLTPDERRRVESNGVIQRIWAIADPSKAPGHPCAGMGCTVDQFCLAYDFENGQRITMCKPVPKNDQSQ